MNELRLVLQHKNKGMGLEKEINLSCEYYLNKKIANIHKKPTPVHVVEVSNQKSPIITKAFYQKSSTTDYNGLYRMKYIDFEAKETRSKSFPLSNIHQHQLDHLVNIDELGGLAFIIVRFLSSEETFLIRICDIINYVNTEKKKTIPIEYFKQYGTIIAPNFNPRLDFLKAVDKAFLEELK